MSYIFWIIFTLGLSELYGKTDDVILLNSENFNEYAINSDSPILVEFYANWCGHCKNLASDWKKAASTLKGVGRMGGVDSDENKELAQKYNVQGFPTLMFFAKGKMTEYKGPRTADAIVEEYLRFLGQLVRIRMNGSSGSKKQERNSGDGTVVELSDSSFDSAVLGGSDAWFVKFYAPWCGHCKNLEPIWKQLASKLSGKVKVGAVDSTKNDKLSQRFEIRGYPTLKYFKAGSVTPEGVTYEGGRSLEDMVSWVEQQLANSAPAVKLTELTSQATWDDMCGTRSLCLISFLPHLLDCDSSCRVNYQNMLQNISDSSRAVSYGWLWAEGGVQRDLEAALDVGGFGYPAMVIVSRTRMRFGVFKGRFDEEGINEFLGRVVTGRVSTSQIIGGSLPTVRPTDPWDGRDAQPITEEDIDLSDVFGDDL